MDPSSLGKEFGGVVLCKEKMVYCRRNSEYRLAWFAPHVGLANSIRAHSANF